ncbi:uncharacterized protein FIBRA_05183 [Fibroporia radiculosa]|uniref:Uncharacterized protein n=1 Tax=Fibroporia radiculosa TaxID=599839 RepID=J4G8R2_9APHY|nr:uncharacterized protein FIBRA_05183 [Fibroporia radiculosa]CCM03063.1 predicted protein [Fibroporia radiculosa]
MPDRTPPSARLRSKTSDFSDLLRGKHPESHVPSPPPLSEPDHSPAKGKSKISFFGRRRKTSSASPSSARSAVSNLRSPQDEDVPPLPSSFDPTKLHTTKRGVDERRHVLNKSCVLPEPSARSMRGYMDMRVWAHRLHVTLSEPVSQ